MSAPEREGAFRPYVAVVGPGLAGPEPDDPQAVAARSVLLADAEELGEGLAHAGIVLVTGGLGGVMEAAGRGAHRAGGTVVGLLPGHDRRAANPSVTVALPTGLGELRNALVVRSSDLVIAVGGSWGTLSEVALAVRTGTPVIALHGWTVSGPRDPVHRVDTPRQAVVLALRLLGIA